MDKQIKQILSEIYDIDPRLEDNERELINIIKKLLASRPDTKFDKAFAKRLRTELVAKERKTLNMSLFQKLGFLIGGAALASLLIVPVVINNQWGESPSVTDTKIDIGSKITMLEEEAFGDLGEAAGSRGSANAGLAESADTASSFYDTRTQSGGGGTSSLIAAPAPDSVSAPREPFVATEYNYVYVGEDISLEEDKLEVLRRNVRAANVGSLAGQFGLGLVNLQNIGNLQFENVSLTQGANSGMRVHINFQSGEISLNQDQGFAAMPEPYRPIQPSEIPANEELIRLADDFVKKHQVNLDGYGEAEVSDSFIRAVDLATTNAQMYLPEVVSVVYPLSIKGIQVYDQGASPQGVHVNINIRTKEVVSLHGLSVQQYEASLYNVETNVETLIDKWQGQNKYVYPSDIEVRTVDINLGTPQLVYVELFKWEDFRGESRLMVPSYRFPVMEKPADAPYYPDHIVMPLVPSLLENQGGPIRIMEGAPAGGSPSALPPDSADGSDVMILPVEEIEE